MKLYLNTASPYARLMRVLLIETGLEAETELTFVDPWQSPEDLLAANPAGKIPVLVTEDGARLTESSCIADYIVLRAGMDQLSPLSQPDAPQQLEILGLGRSTIDCAFGVVVQQRFAPGSALTERWLFALPRIAQRLDGLFAARKPGAEIGLADLTIAVAFDYIDFRLPQANWRNGADVLAAHVAATTRRTSFTATQPK